MTSVETDRKLCHISGMAKHPKRPRDPAQLAKFIVDVATGEIANPDSQEPTAPRGVRGGLKGGKARAAALTPDKRVDIAREAAVARWKKSGD